MSSVPEIRMVRVLDVDKGAPDPQEASVQRGSPSPRALETRAPRVSPAVLVTLALLAGLGAMALGGLAMLQANGKEGGVAGAAATQQRELRQALLLLAKPSTARVPFRGAAGTLVLAVGSGGRAALVLRGFAPALAGKVHRAWIVSTSGRPRHAAAFTGGQQIVPLTGLVGPGSSVVVTTGTAESRVPPARNARIVARV
jgi:hypothetical protein